MTRGRARGRERSRLRAPCAKPRQAAIVITHVDRALPAAGRHVVFAGDPAMRVVGSGLEEGRRSCAWLIHHEGGESRRRQDARRQQPVSVPYACCRGVDDRAARTACILPRDGDQSSARRPCKMHPPALGKRVLAPSSARIIGIAFDQPHARLAGPARTRDHARTQAPQPVTPQRLRFLRMPHHDRLQPTPVDARLDRLARRDCAHGGDPVVAIGAPLPAACGAKRTLAQLSAGAVGQALPVDSRGSPCGHASGGIKLKL